ncbi:MAG: hypothetical protein NC086_06795 [Alistipes sp.]|nr:hypothetical protein [Alistipes sp.]
MRKIFILTMVIITAFYLAYISQSMGNDDDAGHAPWGSYAVSIRDAAPAPAALKTTIPNETPYSFLSVGACPGYRRGFSRFDVDYHVSGRTAVYIAYCTA